LTLAKDCSAVGFTFQDPSFKSKGAAVADEDGVAVVLVGVVDGAGDALDSTADVGAGEDETLVADNEVVSEERQSIATRLVTTALIVGVNEDIIDFTHNIIGSLLRVND